MPLKSGSGQRTMSRNIGEMMRSYDKTGYIGHTRPKTRAKARQIAAAASYRNARKGRRS
jgi:hypothetical protein